MSVDWRRHTGHFCADHICYHDTEARMVSGLHGLLVGEKGGGGGVLTHHGLRESLQVASTQVLEHVLDRPCLLVAKRAREVR